MKTNEEGINDLINWYAGMSAYSLLIRYGLLSEAKCQTVDDESLKVLLLNMQAIEKVILSRDTGDY